MFTYQCAPTPRFNCAARIDRINYSAKLKRTRDARRYAFLQRVLLPLNAAGHDGQGYRGRPSYILLSSQQARRATLSWRITPRLRRLCCCFLPKASITRLNAPSSLIFMRAIRPPVASAEHYTAYRIQRHGCMRNLRDSAPPTLRSPLSLLHAIFLPSIRFLLAISCHPIILRSLLTRLKRFIQPVDLLYVLQDVIWR